MSYVLHGSYAYDTVLGHPGYFKQRILPHSLDQLNVSFNVSEVKEHFGGTAGNIAYNAALLNGALVDKGFRVVWPRLIGAIGGRDGPRYTDHLESQGHDLSGITYVEGKHCAHAWILSDDAGNQLTSYSPGGDESVQVWYPRTHQGIWHLAPSSPREMLRLAAVAQAQGAQVYFDPGQTLAALLVPEAGWIPKLEATLEASTGLFVNDYEAQLLQERLGRPLEHFVKGDDQFIVRTLGAQGAELITNQSVQHVSPGTARDVRDPTGCGDAFRAGFLFGVHNRKSLRESAQLGIALATLAVEGEGGQSHVADVERLVQPLP